MRVSRIYLDSPLQTGSHITLPASTCHYLGNVLRLKTGDALQVFNGDGVEYQATLLLLDRKKGEIAVGAGTPANRESPLHTHLGIAVSKGERMDWVMQKATELGVSTITPLWTERTEVRLKGEREQKKIQHWQNIIIAACEQSGRNTLPTLQPPLPLQDWLATALPGLRLALAPDSEPASSSPLPETLTPAAVTLLIGPEGGLSTTELRLARERAFHYWQLGPRILRTETAPVAALAVLQHRYGDC